MIIYCKQHLYYVKYIGVMSKTNKKFKIAAASDLIGDYYVVPAEDMQFTKGTSSSLGVTYEAISVSEENAENVDYVIRYRMVNGSYETAVWVFKDGSKRELDIDETQIYYGQKASGEWGEGLRGISGDNVPGGKLDKRI